MDEYTYVVNVEGAVVRDGAYLLVERAADEEHAAGLLGFPGGKVETDPGVDAPIEATARRELREEVGIEVGDVEYVHSRTFETDTGAACLDIVTRCEHVGGEARPRSPEEVAAVHWLTPAEIEARDAAPAFLEGDVERLERARTGDLA
ncbi:NUDIX domain-containing protein [Natronomonas marina]|uniref:NUDIX domain-containing protein n=1 Tax=Natronomonas marina TaxID=2961939 RepID=UPI0020C981AE|nr:NUDIX domain-containing protein [Natronomonas marina]